MAGLWLTLRPLLLSSWGGLLLTAAVAKTAYSSGKQLIHLALQTLLPAAKHTLSSRAANLVTTHKLWSREEDDSPELVTNARVYLAIILFIALCCWCNRGAATRSRKRPGAAAWQHLLPFLPSFLFYISNRTALRRGDRTFPGWRQQQVSLLFDHDAAIVRLWLRSSWAGWYRWFSAAYLAITVAFWAASWVNARCKLRSGHGAQVPGGCIAFIALLLHLATLDVQSHFTAPRCIILHCTAMHPAHTHRTSTHWCAIRAS